MRDLQLSSGDLVIGLCGFETVDGTAYLQQRIATALGEPYGDDPYNPTWGSTLQSYIGSPIIPGTASTETSALVSSEVARVMQALMSQQQSQITNSALTGSKTQFEADDIIAAVDSTSAVISPSDPEIIQVSILLTTQAQQQLAISRTVTSA